FEGPDAQEEKVLLLAEIADARAELRQRPSSCYQRTRRESAFEALYALDAGWFDTDTEATDRAHRILDDYVFAELQYGAARTCCWNSTNAAMYDLIMDYNEAHTWDATTQSCHDPVVFKAVAGDYDVFADYAASVGQASAWKAWTADETCSQTAYLHDLEAPHAWTPMCEIADDLLDMAPVPTPDDDPETDVDTTEPVIDAEDAADAVSGGWKCGAGSETPVSSWLVMLGALGFAVLRRRQVRAAG
ncbi:MAG: hypothetical protein QF464_24365, partial [Myxococcota bacterium]|nr:hypothetical protein [Myxococcota bacterium]